MLTNKLNSRVFPVFLNLTLALTLLIGSAAFPARVHAASTITVATSADELNNNGLCSLREAITNANNDAQTQTDCVAGSGNDTIQFGNTLGTVTITLGSTLPTIADLDGLTINGGGDVTVSGNNLYRVFMVNPSIPLTLDNLIVANGKAVSDYGGGVYNNGGMLTITNSAFSGNSTGFSGGGVINDGGTLIIINSAFSGNNAVTGGGGVHNHSGALTITNSAFSGNSAGASSGGGVTNNVGGTLTITNSAFSGNTAITSGGGVLNIGTLTITNSTFTNNISGSGGDMYQGGLSSTLNLYNNILANSGGGGNCVIGDGTVSGNNNLIEDPSTACGFTNGVNGNIIGSDPNLGVMTGSPAYFPLNSGSLAIDAGDDTVCAIAPVSNTSQNGVARPQGAHCDIGAYELDNIAPTVSSIVRASANPTSASSVDFTVTFSEIVTGVDPSDFSLTTSGVSSAAVSGISGTGSVYTVSVNTGTGNGTIRLNMVDDDTIKDGALNPLGAGFTSGETYNVRTTTFADVSTTYWAWQYIERLYNAGVTGGCLVTPLSYCPDNTVTHAQMAIFLLKGMHGSGFTPPAVGASTGFTDVATDYWAAAWIKQLAAEGITGGCGSGNYCPDATVTRAQMAVFLMKAKYGSSYSPPAVGGSTGFTDVATDYWAAAFIKQLVTDGITSGCGTGIYCPDADVTRAQMAVFLVKSFNLP